MPKIEELQQKIGNLRPTETTVSATPVGMQQEQDTKWVKGADGKWVQASCSSEEAAGAESLGNLHATHTEMHGFRGDRSWEAPKCVLRDGSLARTGYTTINRDEFEDSPAVLAAKVKLLASMLKDAKLPIAYTGAGISTASGIPDYATGSSASRAALPSQFVHPLDAAPSDAHRALVQLHAAGLMKAWVQQNHDGLPQKAGFPQAAMNEIHGAWFDPSNPVVKMSGMLRGDLFSSMLELEEAADCCLCVGTSLSGMNADRVAVSVGAASKRQHARGESGPVRPGLVIINLQRTQHDGVCALRIFADASVVLKALAEHLELAPVDGDARAAEIDGAIDGAAAPLQFVMPYSPKDGTKQASGDSKSGGASAACGFSLDLREGATVRIARGQYCGDVARVTGRTRQGHFKLTVAHDLGEGKVKAQVPVYLGKWWILEGIKGQVACFPLVPALA